MMEQQPGSIPAGFIGLKELRERAVATLYGADAIAEIDDIQEHPGIEYLDENGVQRQTVRMEVVRAGQIIPKAVDDERWMVAEASILSELAKGWIDALVTHPTTGQNMKVPRDHWQAGISGLALSIGTYDAAPDPELAGRAVFIAEDAAARLLDEIKREQVDGVKPEQVDGVSPEFFDAPYWSQLQTVAWVFARDRNLVCEVSPDRTQFGHVIKTLTLPDGSKKDVPVTVRPDHFYAVVAGSNSESAPFDSIDAAEADVKDKLVRGKVSAMGLFQGAGTHKAIPATDWLSLKFQWGDDGKPDWVGVNHWSEQHGNTYWTDLRFDREAVLALWPSLDDAAQPIEETNSAQSAGYKDREYPSEAERGKWIDETLKPLAEGRSPKGINRKIAREQWKSAFPNAPALSDDDYRSLIPDDLKRNDGRPPKNRLG